MNLFCIKQYYCLHKHEEASVKSRILIDDDMIYVRVQFNYKKTTNILQKYVFIERRCSNVYYKNVGRHEQSYKQNVWYNFNSLRSSYLNFKPEL